MLLNKKKCVLILGMHRCGTSLLAGCISHFGYWIGDRIMKADEDNPKGYFENRDITNINESILNMLSLKWDSNTPPKAGFQHQIELSHYKKAKKIVNKLLVESNKILIKDPRNCILYPFWALLFKQMELEYKCIIIYRNPIESAYSIEKRRKKQNSIEITHENILKNMDLWLSYYQQLFKDISKGYYLISYQNLISNGILELDLIGQYLEDVDIKYQEIPEFIDAELNRNNMDPKEQDPLQGHPAYKFYKNLNNLATLAQRH